MKEGGVLSKISEQDDNWNYTQNLQKKEMAELFIKQAEQYAEGRPTYPPQLFQFIASKSPSHDLAWDAGTGNGQAARSLAEIYKNVIATDTSPKQLEVAPKLPNIKYQQTPPVMSMAELQQKVAAESSVDTVTVAQAMHWFDLPTFYSQVKFVLKKPDGVIAAWCYTLPEVNDVVDPILRRFYAVDAGKYWEPPRKMVDDKYMNIDFPFEPVDGEDKTGPFEFMAERLMGLDEIFTYLRSWSAYQTAKEMGVELLTDDLIEEFKRGWGREKKLVRFPIYLRIGKAGN
ncbi:putative methyltransferase DDB_G0268948 isoform X1 [Carica papaya]|uniref:putative methyltransferase DDB_G0268948 isoform X1 n=2 Tax=Carica papaya TaxID=3649 RepID=UPI000B8D118E|nr:putative methyltransferase DDB_G0268948 isoform X1 [Carica papaya]XP_021908451.1 putative methyltransferase DDB_G0268948 isoform X1 [Carica papaya]XP_021908452.1 putative methyltransferase DDB_G0268948 isoform X1 [Carica papaya]XP_021908453.1 putative methyltransferase DDB_G0268948 isoform X1 [Carica papaya]